MKLTALLPSCVLLAILRLASPPWPPGGCPIRSRPAMSPGTRPARTHGLHAPRQWRLGVNLWVVGDEGPRPISQQDRRLGRTRESGQTGSPAPEDHAQPVRRGRDLSASGCASRLRRPRSPPAFPAHRSPSGRGWMPTLPVVSLGDHGPAASGRGGQCRRRLATGSLPGGEPDRIVWYRRNAESDWPRMMKTQGLLDLPAAGKDPLLNRTYGGVVRGEGFHSTGPASLKAVHATAAALRVCALTAQTRRRRSGSGR